MEQKYEALPKAEIRLEGRKVIRGDVSGDWGLRLQWEVKHNGKVVATPAARACTATPLPRRGLLRGRASGPGAT